MYFSVVGPQAHPSYRQCLSPCIRSRRCHQSFSLIVLLFRPCRPFMCSTVCRYSPTCLLLLIVCYLVVTFVVVYTTVCAPWASLAGKHYNVYKNFADIYASCFVSRCLGVGQRRDIMNGCCYEWLCALLPVRQVYFGGRLRVQRKTLLIKIYQLKLCYEICNYVWIYVSIRLQ